MPRVNSIGTIARGCWRQNEGSNKTWFLVELVNLQLYIVILEDLQKNIRRGGVIGVMGSARGVGIVVNSTFYSAIDSSSVSVTTIVEIVVIGSIVGVMVVLIRRFQSVVMANKMG